MPGSPTAKLYTPMRNDGPWRAIAIAFLSGADLHLIARSHHMTMEQIAGHLSYAKRKIIEAYPSLEYARRAKWGAIRMCKNWRTAFLRAAQRMAA